MVGLTRGEQPRHLTMCLRRRYPLSRYLAHSRAADRGVDRGARSIHFPALASSADYRSVMLLRLLLKFGG